MPRNAAAAAAAAAAVVDVVVVVVVGIFVLLWPSRVDSGNLTTKLGTDDGAQNATLVGIKLKLSATDGDESSKEDDTVDGSKGHSRWETGNRC